MRGRVRWRGSGDKERGTLIASARPRFERAVRGLDLVPGADVLSGDSGALCARLAFTRAADRQVPPSFSAPKAGRLVRSGAGLPVWHSDGTGLDRRVSPCSANTPLRGIMCSRIPLLMVIAVGLALSCKQTPVCRVVIKQGQIVQPHRDPSRSRLLFSDRGELAMLVPATLAAPVPEILAAPRRRLREPRRPRPSPDLVLHPPGQRRPRAGSAGRGGRGPLHKRP